MSLVADILKLVEQTGWYLFPVRANKFPYKSKKFSGDGMNWGASNDPKVLQGYWRELPDACVGLMCGVESGIFVIDIDTEKGHGIAGEIGLQDLINKHGALPKTRMAESPTGSVHRYYKHPGEGIRVRSTPIAPGVDIKGDGGYVMVPPSVRPGIGAYKWTNPKHAIVDAPAWLLKLVTEKAQRSNGADTSKMNWALPPFDKVVRRVRNATNDDLSWEEWNEGGLLIHCATGGKTEGLDLFIEWSGKSNKYDLDNTKDKWEKFHGSPATKYRPFSILQNRLFEPIRDQREQQQDNRLFRSSAEFVADYTPPDYLIDGLMQRRYVYSFTAPTGSGKTAIALRLACHVALGLSLGNREVERGRVLIFAGENPDDVRSRWIKQCEELKLDPEDMDVVFMPFVEDLNDQDIYDQIYTESEEHGPFSLLIVDTSAAYYSGDDENDNVKLGAHARLLRSFVNLPGGPTVLVTCHPTKTPNLENLLPRGGGAFLAEVDGNLVCIKESQASMMVEVTWHGKFRGPDFKPFAFKLVPGQSDRLIDTKGRKVWSITAWPITEAEQEEIVLAVNRNENEMLRAVFDYPGLSYAEFAEKLNWKMANGDPYKVMVERLLKTLGKKKLVEKRQEDGHYAVTSKGEDVAKRLSKNQYTVITPIKKKN